VQESDGCYRTDPGSMISAASQQSVHNEFAAAARENGKVVEINLHAMLLNGQYSGTLPPAVRRVPGRTQGARRDAQHRSDCHGAAYECDFALAEQMLGKVGLALTNCGRLPPRKGRRERGSSCLTSMELIADSLGPFFAVLSLPAVGTDWKTLADLDRFLAFFDGNLYAGLQARAVRRNGCPRCWRR